MGGEHDAFIKVIIVERIVKAIVLIALAIGLMVAGEKGLLTTWAQYAQDQLNLDADDGVIVHLLLRVLLVVGSFTHVNVVALAPIAYALLVGTEGVGLAMRRRWAEYLTVIPTGILLPYEPSEDIHRPTLFKFGPLPFTTDAARYPPSPT